MTQTVTNPVGSNSGQSAHMATELIQTARRREEETATFTIGGHQALMGIISNPPVYTVTMDATTHTIVTSTTAPSSELTLSAIEKSIYPIEYEQENESRKFILERKNPLMIYFENGTQLPVLRAHKYLKGDMSRSWSFNNLGFFNALGATEGTVPSFPMGPLPIWSDEQYLKQAQNAFALGVEDVQYSLKLLVTADGCQQVRKFLETCVLPSQKLKNINGSDYDFMSDVKEQINNWKTLARVNVEAFRSYKFTKENLIRAICPKQIQIGPTTFIRIAAFILSSLPERQSPIHILCNDGAAWTSDIYGINLPGEDRFIAHSPGDMKYYPIIKTYDFDADADLLKLDTTYLREIFQRALPQSLSPRCYLHLTLRGC